MDLDTSPSQVGEVHDLEIPDHAMDDFKEWVKTQQRRPSTTRAKNWWQNHYSMGDVIANTCDELVAGALNEAYGAARERAKVC